MRQDEPGAVGAGSVRDSPRASRPVPATDHARPPALQRALDVLASADSDEAAVARALLACSDHLQPQMVVAAGALGPAAAPCVPVLRSALFHAIGLDEYAQESTALADVAARALGRIGAPAAPAIPDLRRLARNPQFRDVAEEAIRAIESAPR